MSSRGVTRFDWYQEEKRHRKAGDRLDKLAQAAAKTIVAYEEEGRKSPYRFNASTLPGGVSTLAQFSESVGHRTMALLDGETVQYREWWTLDSNRPEPDDPMLDPTRPAQRGDVLVVFQRVEPSPESPSA